MLAVPHGVGGKQNQRKRSTVGFTGFIKNNSKMRFFSFFNGYSKANY
jgi:hypothetical protein